MKNTLLLSATLFGSLAMFAGSANAVQTISWATLLTGDGSNVTGTMTAGANTVNFTATSNVPYGFVNLNNTGTNYWTGGGYTYNGAYNQPLTSDIVALNAANIETITFSKPVTNLYIAMNSYNGASVTTGSPFVVVSEGCGFWGCGTFNPPSGTSFFGNGEAVGILEIPGTITSFTMTDTVNENWHGFTLGIGAVAAAPEPAAWALMLIGIGGVGSVLRSGRRARALAA